MQNVDDVVIFPVTSHTDHVGQGSTFVAVQGMHEDGIKYIPGALERGATTIVADQTAAIPASTLALIQNKGAQLKFVPNPRRELSKLSAAAYNYPARKLKIIAVTGTKGKTTSTFLIEHIFRTAGYKTALLSSVRNIINGTIYPTHLTTQQPDYLHMFFNTCVKQGVEYVIMEVSAQAIALNRVYGLEWEALLWTNFSFEHGEFYPNSKGNVEAGENDYFLDKVAILKQTRVNAPVVLNADDSCYAAIQKYRADAYSFSFSQQTPFQAHLIKDSKAGIELSVNYNGNKNTYACPTLLGNYNAYNCAGAISLALACNISPSIIAQALNSFTSVPGRLERYILPNGALCIIDLANSPAAFTALLPTLKTMSDHLIVVFGCGGDRDASRRPIMGQVATEYASQVILTTDNPRSENPQDIVAQIMKGISVAKQAHVICELDRAKAIHMAYQLSTPQSIIALLGKGAEQYQLTQGIKHYFSEREIVQALK